MNSPAKSALDMLLSSNESNESVRTKSGFSLLGVFATVVVESDVSLFILAILESSTF